MSKRSTRRAVIGFFGLLAAVAPMQQSHAWFHGNAWGGQSWGGGGSWSHTGRYGGSASGGEGSWSATNRYGATATGGYNHYYGGYYAGYHPPTVVNSYSTGCYNCGGWSTGGALAAGAVGLAAGTAIGASVASANTAAAAPAYAIGAIYPALPSGCAYDPVGPTPYYNCTGHWLTPSYGANGVYYRVVPTP